MKCSDCDNLGCVSDESEQVWGWCWYRRSCPDPDIDRDCPNFALKRPPMLQQLKAENENLRAEMKRMEACIYYKAGGFCRYGGDDPANVCVLGPCAHEVAAHEVIAAAVAEKGDRDVVWCENSEGYHPIHERQPLKVFISDDGMLSVEAYRRSKGKKDWVSYQSRIRYCPYCGREIPIDEKPES